MPSTSHGHCQLCATPCCCAAASAAGTSNADAAIPNPCRRSRGRSTSRLACCAWTQLRASTPPPTKTKALAMPAHTRSRNNVAASVTMPDNSMNTPTAPSRRRASAICPRGASAQVLKGHRENSRAHCRCSSNRPAGTPSPSAHGQEQKRIRKARKTERNCGAERQG